MSFKRLLLWGILAVLLTISAGMVSAQFPENDRRAFQFAITGGRSNNFAYHPPGDLESWRRLVPMLDQIIPMYNTLTGTAWDVQIVIVFMGTSAPNRYALGRMMSSRDSYITRLEPASLFDPDICQLRIFNGWDTVVNFESELAREVFHCLQMRVGAAEFGDFGNPRYAWWLLGGAEWAASRVYPTQYPQAVHSAFNPRADATTARRDAFYFWEFLSSPRGLGSDTNAILQMNTIRGSGTFPILFTYNDIDLMHNWALALINRTLPIPPAVDLSGSDVAAGRGGSVTVITPPFATEFKNLVSYEVQPGNIAFLQVSGISGGNYAVSLRAGGTITRLSEDTPFQFCPTDDGALMIISRGQGSGGFGALTAEWGQVPSPTPCRPAGTPEPDDATCVVGSWVVDTYPADLSDLFPTLDKSGFIFNFGSDSAFAGVYELHAQESDGVKIDLSVPFSGSYAVSPRQGSSTEFAVQTFVWDFEAGGTQFMTSRNGTVTDVTQQFYDNADLTLWSPDGTIICDGDSLSWVATGGDGFVLTRLP